MTELKNILVDDVLPPAKMLLYNLSQNRNNQVGVTGSGHNYLYNLYKKPNVVALDYNYSGDECEYIIDPIQEYNSEIFIIIVSGQRDVATAVNLMNKEIYDYLVKDVHLKSALNKTIDEIRAKIEVKRKNCEKT